MSSPPKEKMEKVETKGGHLPAVKAGGMRIVQKHQPVAAAAAPEPVPKDDEEEDEEEYVSSSPPKVPVIVSGVVTKGDKDFTPAAAQVAHQKPQPCVSKLPASQHINQPIHQPRK
ncbi:death-associated protein 1 homolog [Pseudochaenichthys georgianus]|uniref:death-associated protein 1 homolog n=1 Tax=Pseudochaenichthys georgianus TaxID=52239 RepID=UPI00146F186E|nr:death-associated protein 1 [Pseudochaenichthys georgianus]